MQHIRRYWIKTYPMSHYCTFDCFVALLLGQISIEHTFWLKSSNFQSNFVMLSFLLLNRFDNFMKKQHRKKLEVFSLLTTKIIVLRLFA